MGLGGGVATITVEEAAAGFKIDFTRLLSTGNTTAEGSVRVLEEAGLLDSAAAGFLTGATTAAAAAGLGAGGLGSSVLSLRYSFEAATSSTQAYVC